MTRNFILGSLAVAVMLTGCSGGNGSSAAISRTSASKTAPTASTPFDLPVDTGTPSDTPAPAPTQGADFSFTLTTKDGDLTISIGEPLGKAVEPNGATWVGVPVRMAGAVADFQATNLAIGPVTGGSDGYDANANGSNVNLVGTDNITPVACKGMALLNDALASTDTTAMGCVYFGYDAKDKPTHVIYEPNAPNDMSASVTWTITAPGKGSVPVSGVKYTITSDNGISNVTYSTAGFNQEQDTSVQGKTWTKTISKVGVSVADLLAQNAGGGTITCIITVDGEQVAKQSSHGQYAIVTCSASNF